MDFIIQFFSEHAMQAHWFLLIGLLLAGCNLPISIDLLAILAAFFSAQYVPEKTFLLYLILLFGCMFSAWISYAIGRTLGRKLLRLKFFQHFLSEKKMEKLRIFYKKYGMLTFLIGRFIPFGVRNCLFMSSGISKTPFLRFALQDGLACFVWATSYFVLFYHIGQNLNTIWHYVKTFNVFIFLIFALAVISIIWYKQAKNLTLRRQIDKGSDKYNT